MKLSEEDIKKIGLIGIVVLFAVLVFLIVRPIFLSIFGGLLLAYIFYPVYKKTLKIVRYKNLAAALVSVFILLIIFVPLFFLIPIATRNIFNFFQLTRNFDFATGIKEIFPGISEQITNQVVLTANTAVTKLSSVVIDSAVNLVTNFAVIGLQLLIVAFVFFFALRDGPELGEFVSAISPLKKFQHQVLAKQFEDMTKAVVYGHVIVGFIQGILAGLGFLIFGVPNVLILTIFAVIMGILPVIGPGSVYIPVAIYLFMYGNPALAIIFLLYNLLIVSTVDNFLRARIVSRRTKISQVIVLIGMVGGLFVFGVLGLVLGPLILAYFITFLEAYKNKTLSSMFETS
jgi:predicted PurR-regulated permease PerM